MIQNNKRLLTPYEKNQLLKYKLCISKNSNLVERLNNDSPIEYITKHVDFCNLNFFVNQAVLIPRIETEELVELTIRKAQIIHKNNEYKIINIIDAGTGSGAIAISIAKQLEIKKIKYHIIALDISNDALKIAKKNLQIIDKNLNIEFKKSDLLSSINYKYKEKIDIIVANLPYIPSNRIAKLDKSVKNFEPHLALDGGADGLFLIRKFLSQTKSLISENSLIMLELDITHTEKKMKEFNNNWLIKIIESKYGGVNFGLLKLIKK